MASSTAAMEFIKKVGEDQTLYERMHQTVGEFSEQQQDDSVGPKVVEIGREYGYNFSADEVKQAFMQFKEQELTTTSGELSDQQLDKVAGGYSKSYGGSYSYALQPYSSVY